MSAPQASGNRTKDPIASHTQMTREQIASAPKFLEKEAVRDLVTSVLGGIEENNSNIRDIERAKGDITEALQARSLVKDIIAQLDKNPEEVEAQLNKLASLRDSARFKEYGALQSLKEEIEQRLGKPQENLVSLNREIEEISQKLSKPHTLDADEATLLQQKLGELKEKAEFEYSRCLPESELVDRKSAAGKHFSSDLAKVESRLRELQPSLEEDVILIRRDAQDAAKIQELAAPLNVAQKRLTSIENDLVKRREERKAKLNKYLEAKHAFVSQSPALDAAIQIAREENKPEDVKQLELTKSALKMEISFARDALVEESRELKALKSQLKEVKTEISKAAAIFSTDISEYLKKEDAKRAKEYFVSEKFEKVLKPEALHMLEEMVASRAIPEDSRIAGAIGSYLAAQTMRKSVDTWGNILTSSIERINEEIEESELERERAKKREAEDPQSPEAIEVGPTTRKKVPAQVSYYDSIAVSTVSQALSSWKEWLLTSSIEGKTASRDNVVSPHIHVLTRGAPVAATTQFEAAVKLASQVLPGAEVRPITNQWAEQMRDIPLGRHSNQLVPLTSLRSTLRDGSIPITILPSDIEAPRYFAKRLDDGSVIVKAFPPLAVEAENIQMRRSPHESADFRFSEPSSAYEFISQSSGTRRFELNGQSVKGPESLSVALQSNTTAMMPISNRPALMQALVVGESSLNVMAATKPISTNASSTSHRISLLVPALVGVGTTSGTTKKGKVLEAPIAILTSGSTRLYSKR